MSSPPVPPSAFPEAPPPRGGVGKKVLIGCGVIALVLAAGFLAFVLYARSHPETITDFVMSQVRGHYAPDVTEQDKRDLDAAYADFRRAIQERRVSREPLNQMRATISTTGPQSEFHRSQVRELTDLFRRSTGSEPSPAATPASVASPVPNP